MNTVVFRQQNWQKHWTFYFFFLSASCIPLYYTATHLWTTFLLLFVQKVLWTVALLRGVRRDLFENWPLAPKWSGTPIGSVSKIIFVFMLSQTPSDVGGNMLLKLNQPSPKICSFLSCTAVFCASLTFLWNHLWSIMMDSGTSWRMWYYPHIHVTSTTHSCHK